MLIPELREKLHESIDTALESAIALLRRGELREEEAHFINDRLTSLGPPYEAQLCYVYNRGGSYIRRHQPEATRYPHGCDEGTRTRVDMFYALCRKARSNYNS